MNLTPKTRMVRLAHVELERRRAAAAAAELERERAAAAARERPTRPGHRGKAK